MDDQQSGALNPWGRWCGMSCLTCEENLLCYASIDCISDEYDGDDIGEEGNLRLLDLADVLEDDYSEDSLP
jgi:hypothetical protein